MYILPFDTPSEDTRLKLGLFIIGRSSGLWLWMFYRLPRCVLLPVACDRHQPYTVAGTAPDLSPDGYISLDSLLYFGLWPQSPMLRPYQAHQISSISVSTVYDNKIISAQIVDSRLR